MKALSLKQPWAELLIQGKKKIEIRKWNTSFRGKFLVHASKNPDKEALERFNMKGLSYGVIIGTAELKDVKKYNDEEEFQKDKDSHLADSSFGLYGFIIENPKRIKPVEYKGMLNFWNGPDLTIVPSLLNILNHSN